MTPTCKESRGNKKNTYYHINTFILSEAQKETFFLTRIQINFKVLWVFGGLHPLHTYYTLTYSVVMCQWQHNKANHEIILNV